MSKTLVPIPQITPPPNINSNSSLLTNISAFNALNPKEKMALAVYFRAKELANDTSSPLTTYDPATDVGLRKLVQDANTVFGNIPENDLKTASLAIDWQNCRAVYAALPSEVDTLRGLVRDLAARPNDELLRILLYLRLEIGE